MMPKNSKFRTVLGWTAAALLVGSVAAGVAYAQQAGPKAGQAMMGGRMARRPLMAMRRGLAQLGLSDAQKAEIKGIVQGQKPEWQALAQRLQQARRSVGDAIANDAPEATVRAESAKLAAVQADLAVMREKVHQQVFAVLTPDQQAKAKTLRAQRMARVDRFLARRKAAKGW
jgi:periplasmic protein CpxP/Spy